MDDWARLRRRGKEYTLARKCTASGPAMEMPTGFKAERLVVIAHVGLISLLQRSMRISLPLHFVFCATSHSKVFCLNYERRCASLIPMLRQHAAPDCRLHASGLHLSLMAAIWSALSSAVLCSNPGRVASHTSKLMSLFLQSRCG